MCAVKKNIPQEIELTGTVAVKKIAIGSKSEHNAVIFQTEQGDYVLRKLGGNAFYDPSLLALEGKSVTAKGIVDQKLFLAKKITSS